MAPSKQKISPQGGSPQNQQQQRDAAKPRSSTITNTTKSTATSVRLAGLADQEDDEQDTDEADSSLSDETESADEFEDEEDEDEDEVDLEEGKPGIDDDDYADIPDASDDGSGNEEDEGIVLRAAEHDLIDEFERSEQRRNTTSVANDFDNMFLQDNDSDWNPVSSMLERGTVGYDMNEDPFVGLASNDSLYQAMWNDAEDALASWRLPGIQTHRTGSHDSTGTKKRVRFEEETHIEMHSRSSSMNSSEDPNEAFPDLFSPQDDALLRQRFGLDVDPDATFDHDYSDTGSCYDFDGAEERIALAIDKESDSEEDATSTSTVDDEGDTTDEETEEESLARMRAMQRARGILRSPRLAPVTPKQAKRMSQGRSSNPTRPVTPKSNKTPRQGVFALDPTRAAMSTDATGKEVRLIPPAKPLEKDQAFWRRAKSAASSRRTSHMSSPGLSFHSPGAARMPPRPFTAQSTLASMFNGNLDLLSNDSGSAVATDVLTTVPATFLASRPQTSFGSATLTEDDSDAELEDVNMQDFFDIDGYDSDSDDMEATLMDTPSRDDCFDTAGAHSNEYGLLDHLDQQRGLVGSFRLNQNQAKLVSSLASHPAKRALTLESNAMQKGRRAAANTPMTPARKKRGSQDLGLTGSGIRKAVSSPLSSRRPRSRGASLSAMGMQQTLSPSIMQ